MPKLTLLPQSSAASLAVVFGVLTVLTWLSAIAALAVSLKAAAPLLLLFALLHFPLGWLGVLVAWPLIPFLARPPQLLCIFLPVVVGIAQWANCWLWAWLTLRVVSVWQRRRTHLPAPSEATAS